MDALIKELKEKIVTILDFNDITVDDIGDDDPLVGGDLGIDSVDVLEMVMMIEKDYGVRIDNREMGVQVFSTIKTLAEHIAAHRSK